MSKNANGLLRYTTARKSDTEVKVNQAIDALKRSKTKKINFKTVSEISTTTLYNNPVLRERISSLRAVKKTNIDLATPVLTRERKYQLRQEIRKLK